MKLIHSFSGLGLLAVVFLSVTSVVPQSKQKIVQWAEIPISDRNTQSSGHSEVLAQIEALEIIDVTVGGKSITLGEPFDAGDEWLKTLAVRLRNVSSLTISKVQMNFFLPEIMPGGPMVTLCYGCGDVGIGETISPGEAVEMRLVFYSWVVEQINAKSSLSRITKAEVWNIMVTPANGKQWLSGCMKTANQKNACPKPAP